MIESGQLNTTLEPWVRSLTDSTQFMDAAVPRIMNRERFINPVPQLVETTVCDQVQLAAVQAGLQEAVRAVYDVLKLEPVEIPSQQSASSSDEKKALCRKIGSLRSSKYKSKKSSSSSSQNVSSLSPSSNTSSLSILFLLPVNESFCTALG